MAALGAMTLTQVQAQSEKSGANLSQGVNIMELSQSTLKADDGDSWLDYAAESYAGGTGTEADPYLIETPEQLARLCLDATGKEGESFETNLLLKGVYFKQTADIDLSAHSVNQFGIGLNGSFAGIYDGNGFKIKGYHYLIGTISEHRENISLGGSLFVNVNQATIKNVTIEGFSMDAAYLDASGMTYTVGSLVSFAHNTKIENCTTSGETTFSIIGEGNTLRVAGIAGFAKDSEIKNCHASGTFSCNMQTKESQNDGFTEAAGIVAEADGETTLSDCTSSIDIQNKGEGTSSIIVRSAGIAAWVQNAQLHNCANTGNLSAKSSVKDDYSWVQVGGMIACINDKASMWNCWNAGPVSSEGAAADQLAAPLVCYWGNEVSYSSCSYNKDLFTAIEGVNPLGDGLTTEFMQSKDFVERLNQELPTDCLSWKYVEDSYPVIGESGTADPTAVEAVGTAQTTFRTQAGGIAVTAQEPTQVAVYTFQGAMQESRLVPGGTTTISLPEGLYILKLGDESHKIKVRR